MSDVEVYRSRNAKPSFRCLFTLYFILDAITLCTTCTSKAIAGATMRDIVFLDTKHDDITELGVCDQGSILDVFFTQPASPRFDPRSRWYLELDKSLRSETLPT
jgi:hypothetical protein